MGCCEKETATTRRKIDQLVKKDPSKNITTAYDYQEEGSQKAELDFKVLGKLNDHYLIEVKPITGRPHQIRVQLAELGCPIRGDLRYGFAKPNPDKSINLHAKGLYFEHPVKKEPLIIRAGLPNDQFWEQFLTLEKIKIKDKNVDKIY